MSSRHVEKMKLLELRERERKINQLTLCFRVSVLAQHFLGQVPSESNEKQECVAREDNGEGETPMGPRHVKENLRRGAVAFEPPIEDILLSHNLVFVYLDFSLTHFALTLL